MAIVVNAINKVGASMRDICEILLCYSVAEFIDEMGNICCEECMQEEINNGDAVAEDFETLI